MLLFMLSQSCSLLRRSEECRRREETGEMLFIVAEAAQQRCTWENHYDAPSRRGSGLWFWYHSGPERLKHPIPLSENGLTGSGPLARSSQTVLIRSKGTQQNLQSQSGILQEEPQYVWSNPQLFCQRVKVRDVVHLEGVTVWAGISNRGKQTNKNIIKTKNCSF